MLFPCGSAVGLRSCRVRLSGSHWGGGSGHALLWAEAPVEGWKRVAGVQARSENKKAPTWLHGRGRGGGEDGLSAIGGQDCAHFIYIILFTSLIYYLPAGSAGLDARASHAPPSQEQHLHSSCYSSRAWAAPCPSSLSASDVIDLSFETDRNLHASQQLQP